MRFRYRHLILFGIFAVFLSLLRKFVFERDKQEELRYWLEYYANRLGLIEVEKSKTLP
jgi:hypothetical protein